MDDADATLEEEFPVPSASVLRLRPSRLINFSCPSVGPSESRVDRAEQREGRDTHNFGTKFVTIRSHSTVAGVALPFLDA